MNKYERYNISEEEMKKINAIGADPFEGKCSCAIHDNKPSFCRQGPLPQTRTPYCGYTFIIGANDEVIRQGECKRCGRCCSMPRRECSPYGVYDPRGGPCKHLIVEDK